MSYYIYKHLDKENNVIYVGQTKNLKNRIVSHKTSSSWFSLVKTIEYAEVTDRILMNIYEKLYIDRYSPIYNKKDMDCEYSRFFKNMEELYFKEYNPDIKNTKNFIGDYTNYKEVNTKLIDINGKIGLCIPIYFINDIESYKKGIIIFPHENEFEIFPNTKENLLKSGFKITTKTLLINKNYIRIIINKHVQRFYNIMLDCELKIIYEYGKIKVTNLIEKKE